MSALSIARAADVEDTPAHSWLVESLWAHRAVGVIGAQPKSGKSWLALDLGVSVASGTPALDRFRVADPGPVLLFPAEDPLHAVRTRLEGICRHRGLDFDRLDLWLIQTPIVRLDQREDRESLESTVADLHPRLLVLDPFIRLHSGIDENSATEIARILAFLRALEREHAVAVCLIHHARKAGVGDPGLGLRGSTEFRAWGDSNLFLRRRRGLELVVEHRCAPSPEPLRLTLATDEDDNTYLAVEETPPAEPDLASRILTLLRDHGAPLSREDIRQHVGVRNQTVGETLAQLVHLGRLQKDCAGYRLKGANSDDQGNATRAIPALCWGATS